MVLLSKFRFSLILLLALCALELVDSKKKDKDKESKKAKKKSKDKDSDEVFDEKGALDWVVRLEKDLEYWCNKATSAAWESGSNITDYTEQVSMNTSVEYANFKKDEVWNKAKKYKWQEFKNKTLKRQLMMMSNIGSDALPEEDMLRYTNVTTSMQNLYSTSKVPDMNDASKMLPLTPDLEEILRNSSDYDEQEYVWTAWRNATGRKMIDLFKEYVEFENKAADLNGKKNAYIGWTTGYETTTLRETVLEIWKQVQPLYLQLHAYVRRQLVKEYPGKLAKDGLIPAHILGGMWGQSWLKMLSHPPFDGKESVDITDDLVKQGYTPTKIFLLADDFFSSLGFSRLPFSFWRDSILEKPKDGRELQCHATAWDFCNAKDFRIRMCTQITMKDLITAHHEVGHNMYHMSYKDQIQYFRDGANDGFHEAIGDCIAYSASTPKHLRKIGLLQTVEDDEEATINYLYKEALDKMAFLPFALIIDSWRWDIFEGKVKPEEYNCHWWKLRRTIQGLKPPNVRTSEDLDAGAKYHVPYGVPYIRYFVSGIVQLQFHKALCTEAGEYDPADPKKPLHNCDIYGSKEAGKKFRDMLKLGSSKPWPEALKKVTGSTELSADAFLEYFKPLHDWLIKDNKKHKAKIGWKDDGENLCVSAE